MSKDIDSNNESSNKESLMKEFFKMGGSHHLEKYNKLYIKLKDFLDKNGDDDQIISLVNLVKLYRLMPKKIDFNRMCDTIRPIFKYLQNKDTELWDLYDLLIFIGSIGHTYEIDEALVLIDKSISILESKYINEYFYEESKLLIYVNFIGCLISFHCSVEEEEREKVDTKNLIPYCIKIALELCGEKEKFIIPKAIVLIRKGIFHDNNDLMEEGFEVLEKNNETELHKLMTLEKNTWKYLIENILSKETLRIQLGENLRAYRESLTDKTAEKMSVELGFEPHVLGQVERGVRDAPPFLLYKFSEVTNISLDEIMKGKGFAKSINHKATVQQISLIAQSLEEKNAKTLLGLANVISESDKKEKEAEKETRHEDF